MDSSTQEEKLAHSSLKNTEVTQQGKDKSLKLLSDMSKDEKRLLTRRQQKRKMQKPEDIDTGDDLDELTESSDTSTDDMDSANSGYRHPSLLMLAHSSSKNTEVTQQGKDKSLKLLSDVSDDEKRLLTRRQQKRKMQKPEDIDTGDDLDELTESSDTSTDDMDSANSGYRHASLLMLAHSSSKNTEVTQQGKDKSLKLLSDVSDNEKRLLTRRQQKRKMQKPEDIDTGDDLDELTESSDTSTDDMDSANSGYRHASPLMLAHSSSKNTEVSQQGKNKSLKLLSDVSDDEKRLLTRRQQKRKTQKTKDIDTGDDLDELTESSDTSTDDMDSATSGYRHASLPMLAHSSSKNTEVTQQGKDKSLKLLSDVSDDEKRLLTRRQQKRKMQKPEDIDTGDDLDELTESSDTSTDDMDSANSGYRHASPLMLAHSSSKNTEVSQQGKDKSLKLLSDVSDDEKRLLTRRQQKRKTQKTKDIDTGDDLDELTESSDTSTDDMDSATSGYRHASLPMLAHSSSKNTEVTQQGKDKSLKLLSDVSDDEKRLLTRRQQKRKMQKPEDIDTGDDLDELTESSDTSTDDMDSANSGYRHASPLMLAHSSSKNTEVSQQGKDKSLKLLSDVSDDEKRLLTRRQQKRKTQKTKDIDTGDDLDELTESSDTSTDDMDSATSGYRLASLPMLAHSSSKNREVTQQGKDKSLKLLSDVSDDEKRLLTRRQQKRKMQKPEDIDTGDDLDELTESSDTSTDDMDSANSGYRHASLLMLAHSSSKNTEVTQQAKDKSLKLLSDVSDDEKRLLTRRQQKRKMQKPEDIDTGDDLDELTESSDTSTDDMDSATSGFRHASPLMLAHSSSKNTEATQQGKDKSLKILSDVSDDEKRLLTRRQQKRKTQKPEDIDTGDDLDELTESSDTSTDDMDSATSGYRLASLLMQRLSSSTFNSTSITKLKNISHEYELAIEKVKSRHGYLEEKVCHLEMERETLKGSLEEVKDAKSLLERNQLELQTQVTNLKFQLKQEQENRHNATMMYNATRDKLRRLEEQQQMEVQVKQKVELDMRTLISNTKQLEEEHAETQRLLAQERSTRALQENLLNSHLRKQQEVENKRIIISSSSEALSQLTEASDRERELQQTASLQEQLSMLRTDLERSQANCELKESHLLEENKTLKEQLEDARRDLKISNDSVAQTVFTCNNQLAALKAELAKTASRLENERQARVTLEAEVESTRSRLAGAVKEAELRLAAHSDSEKTLIWEREEHQRIRDRLNGELASQREAVNSLTQKLDKAEARANSMENEVYQVTLQLTEKGLLLDVLQRENEQAATRTKELENALHAEREQVSRAAARREAMQKRLAQAQSEAMLLRQQLEEAINKGSTKERGITDAQDRFKDILSKLRSDGEGRVQMVEDRNKELAAKAADLRDQIYKLEEEKNERETSMRQLQQELADSLKKLSMSEASLEVNTRYRNDLEEEKARLLKDNDRLRVKLDESEDQYVQAERRLKSLKSSLGDREKELSSAAQKLQEALSAAAAAELTVKQLEGAVQRLEIENARLKAADTRLDLELKSRSKLSLRLAELEKEKGELTSQMEMEKKKAKKMAEQKKAADTRLDLELKSRSKLSLRLAELEKEKGELTSQMEMEKKKAKKMAEQKKAADTRLDLELKSRSKLNLRLAELKKEKGELTSQMEMEKKKAKKMAEQKKAADTRLDLEMKRNIELQKELYTFGWMKEKVDYLQGQLEKETSLRNQLEKINEELKDQVASLKGLGRSHDEQERSKRLLEEEVLELRRQLEANQIQREQYRREMEEKAQRDLKEKLEQVNLFLQSQAASQEQLDQLNAANEANLRTQLEQRIQKLEAELGRARSGQLESLNQRDSELERYRQLYIEEMRQRKSLAAKLDRTNSRLSEANSKLLSECSRSFLANGSPVGLSPADPGATFGSLNRSFGFPFSPVTECRVEDYLAKMQSELDKNISTELSKAWPAQQSWTPSAEQRSSIWRC